MCTEGVGGGRGGGGLEGSLSQVNRLTVSPLGPPSSCFCFLSTFSFFLFFSTQIFDNLYLMFSKTHAR